MMETNRRHVLAGIGLFAFVSVRAPASSTPQPFRMWHSPGCGCCLEWARQAEAFFGVKPVIAETPDMAAIKRARGVPAELQGCHTALIGRVVVEGHVPPADIRRLLQGTDRNIVGLAVPGMPLGAPGMDGGHGRTQPYKVHAFKADGTHMVFASHGG